MNGDGDGHGDGHSDDGSHKPVYEKFANKDGEHLTSVKPRGSFEHAPAVDEKPTHQSHQPHSSELVSGRRAGAGWEKSA